MSYAIFLSHSSEDEHLAQLVKREVEVTARASVYLADEDVQLGHLLSDKVQRAIRGSDAVVVLVTEHSRSSAWVNHEIGYALRDKLVIPLVEAGVDMQGFGMLAGYEYARFDPSDPSQAVDALSTFVITKANAKDLQQLALVLVLVSVVVILYYSTDGQPASG